MSFDLLSLKTVERIQFWAEDEVEGDYLNVSEVPFFDGKGLWNTLRLGRKFSKPSPMFVRRFYAKHNPHLKSLQHFCKTPNFPPRFKSSFMNLEAMISVYNMHAFSTSPFMERVHRIRDMIIEHSKHTCRFLISRYSSWSLLVSSTESFSWRTTSAGPPP